MKKSDIVIDVLIFGVIAWTTVQAGFWGFILTVLGGAAYVAIRASRHELGSRR